MCTTMPMKRTSPSWTSSSENRPCLVKNHNSIPIKKCFPEFERSPKMTWLNFISGFGGICGLCLGISFMSMAEILYWFSIRLCKKFWSINNNKKLSVFAIYFDLQVAFSYLSVQCSNTICITWWLYVYCAEDSFITLCDKIVIWCYKCFTIVF